MNETASLSVNKSIEMAVKLVAAYVSRNPLPSSELPRLIAKVQEAIIELNTGVVGATDGPGQIEMPSAAQIRASVQYDGIVSFIDGRSYKTLKRHLTANGLHPQSYRERYGLPFDYPMVAPAYSAFRAGIAKTIGLGVPSARGDGRRIGTGR